MKKNRLGNTDLYVTELCFGALPFGPLQKNVPMEECTEIITEALKAGINFIDTAQMYGTYEPIRRAVEATGIRPVIATKSTAATYEDMQNAVEEALCRLNTDTIDIFLIHAARADESVFVKRKEALRCLLDYKSRGIIKAVGISSHSVRTIRAAAKNSDLDIVFPILNIKGLGILHGTREDMEEAVAECVAAGKGVYIMKALGGGILIDSYRQALDYVRGIPGIASVAVGMVSLSELSCNLRYFSGEFSGEIIPDKPKKRFIVVKSLCTNCGNCRETCPNEAILESGGVSVINHEKCLTCGYCVSSCGQFAIRMV
jgi:Aldo/keto reductase family.